MRRRIRAVLVAMGMAAGLVLAGPGPVAAAETATPAPYQGSFLKRITLLVSDLERSLTLYRDVLGFEPGMVFESAASSYSYTVFSIDPAAKIRGVMLSAGPDQVRTLAVFEIKGQPVTVPAAPKPVAAVIRVPDMPKLMAAVQGLGLTTYPSRPLKTPEGATGTEWAFLDFDGHLIVVYSLDAAETAPKR